MHDIRRKGRRIGGGTRLHQPLPVRVRPFTKARGDPDAGDQELLARLQPSPSWYSPSLHAPARRRRTGRPGVTKMRSLASLTAARNGMRRNLGDRDHEPAGVSLHDSTPASGDDRGNDLRDPAGERNPGLAAAKAISRKSRLPMPRSSMAFLSGLMFLARHVARLGDDAGHGTSMTSASL